MKYETERIEFKSQFTEEIYKEIIAFANTDGGVVYVGIDNDGNVIGLENVDEEYTRITNGIRDAIIPDVTMFVKYSIQDGKVVEITVSEGTNKPYYLRKKGLKPSGVYVRQGTSSTPASYEMIRQMIKDNDGDVYEKMRSMEQELTFESTVKAFKKRNVEFSPEKYRTLGLVQREGNIFTNLALLLSDQCTHTTKVAVFGDEENTVFKDTKEFGGSIFKQLEDTFGYLTLCNNTKSIIKGFDRIDIKDYPDEAVREALLNAVAHRDYAFSGSIMIYINNKQMEITSMGGLVSGLSPEDIRTGISQSRNKNLAEVLHRLHFIESYGTGIRRIYRLYEDCPVQPQIDITTNTFKMILPNMNFISNLKTVPVTEQMQIIMDYIKEKGQITDLEIGKILKIKRTRIYNIVKEMKDLNLIYAKGRGEDKRYYLKMD